ncbi:hypothetical protein [Tabrizicola sp.]
MYELLPLLNLVLIVILFVVVTRNQRPPPEDGEKLRPTRPGRGRAPY